MVGVMLGVQMLTGIWLGMHYKGSIELAFASVDYIGREVGNGATIRAMHGNGASLIFLGLYLHIGRGIYYGSYKGRGPL